MRTSARRARREAALQARRDSDMGDPGRPFGYLGTRPQGSAGRRLRRRKWRPPRSPADKDPNHARLPQVLHRRPLGRADHSLDTGVINPATEAVAGHISMGSAADVDAAVQAARRAFESYSQSSVDERVALLERIIAEYRIRHDDIAAAITEEMGAPTALARKAQAAMGIGHLQTALTVLQDYAFSELRGTTLIRKEPIGVCGLITPWNWPVNQIACKVAPALATGCTMVLKALGDRPFSAQIWTEILDAAGVPAGSSTWSTATVPPWAPPLPATRKWTWCRLPAAPAPASRWRATRRRPSSGCTRSWWQVAQHHPA